MLASMADGAIDYQRSARHRRHSWYGAKRLVKRLLALPGVHTVMRGGAALLGDRIHRERLPAPARLGQVMARMSGTTFVMLRPDRCIVAKELYWGAGRRPRVEDQFALDLFAALARDARLVLDVGAYTGVFSLLAARAAPQAQVHAFEVVPEVAQAARENVAANGLAGRITVHNAGVGKDGDTVTIAPGGGGSALPDYYSMKLRFADGVPVGVRSLDAIVADIALPPPAVVKIDVEGTEDVVLEHAQAFLASHAPDILCEILADANTSAVHSALSPLGYRLYRVERGTLSAQPDLVPSTEFRDWLFTTKTVGELADRGIPVA
jgi:FkbM family methyltransferase